MFRVLPKVKSGSYGELRYGNLCKETSNNDRGFILYITQYQYGVLSVF